MAVDIGVKVGVEGESAFKKSIEDINRSYKVLGSEMKLIESQFGKTEHSMESLRAKNTVLNKEIDTQKSKVSALEQALKNAAVSFGESDSRTQNWTIKLNKAKAELNDLSHQVSKNDQTMQDMAQETADAEKALRDLGAETRDAKSAMQSMESETENTGNALDRVGEKAGRFRDILRANLASDMIVGGLRGIGEAVVEIGRSFGGFASDGIKMASDLQETQNVVDTTFGANTEAVNQFAQSAATSFGIGEKSAKQYAGTMGATLKSMGLTDDAVLKMSTDMTGLAGDMASFYNLDSEEAFAKIRSGISGETEPLKQLGINMSVANLEAFALSEGMDASYKSMSQVEQATLRYQYLMKATADAQGDFAKTLPDSYANQMRVLELNIGNVKTALGEQLLPIVLEVATALNDFLAGNIGLDGFISDMSDLVGHSLPGLLESAGAVLNALGTELIENLPAITEVGSQILTSLINGFTSGIQTAAPLVAGMITAIVSVLIENADQLIYGAMMLISVLCEGLIAALPTLAENAPAIVGALILGILSSGWQLVNVGLELIVQLLSGIARCFESLVQIGRAIMGQIFKGLVAVWSSIVEWFNGVWQSLFGNRTLNIKMKKSIEEEKGGSRGDSPKSGDNPKGGNGGSRLIPISIDGSHADGLPYVPFDGYIAELHRGEAVLPAHFVDSIRSIGSIPINNTNSVVTHTGVIRVEGVNSEAETMAVVDVIMDELARNARR